MKHKLLAVLLAIACAFCLAFGTTACEDNGGDSKNETEQGGTNTPDDENPDGENPDGENPDGENPDDEDPEDEDIPETEGLEFALNDDGESYSVTGIGSVTATKIRIPAEYNGKPVTSIGDEAFSECENLTRIIIPDSVTIIGDAAFVYCTSIVRIVIPDSVTTIGLTAFGWCSSLTSITIPDSVTELGWYAFAYCTSLESLVVSNGNTVYYSDGNCIIDIENKALIAGCSSSVIPSDGSVTVIVAGAFTGCESLTSIIIPNSVTAIGGDAFFWCGSLTSITIPDSVTFISDYAFSNCYNLESVIFENTTGWSADGKSIASSDLADPVTAAKYLKSTYSSRNWERS